MISFRRCLSLSVSLPLLLLLLHIIELPVSTALPYTPHTITTSAVPIPSHEHIPQYLYEDLARYAHLIDIAYCISSITRIQEPFQCDNGCDEFNNTEVIFQWTTDDLDLNLDWRSRIRPLTVGTKWLFTDRFATSGYIALLHDNHTIAVVLRGTRSFKDTIVDLNADMVDFSLDCPGCKVHTGFYNSYQTTWRHIEKSLMSAVELYPSYKVVVMGHSMGGAVSLLLTLELLKYKHEEGELLCITMGQPMVGNRVFAHYADSLLHLRGKDHFEEGYLYRITHKNDPVVKLPISDKYIIGDKYSHTSNEIFINELGHQLPQLESVVFCEGSEDPFCSYGMKFTTDNTEHLNYFRRMGMCGVGFPYNNL